MGCESFSFQCYTQFRFHFQSFNSHDVNQYDNFQKYLIIMNVKH